MQYGLPELQHPSAMDDATENTNALGQFAQDLAEWLRNFASGMYTYRLTDGYQKAYDTSLNALAARRRHAGESR